MKLPIETTTMSTRGQVVLPQEVRERLNLGEGTKFLVMAEKDTVLLKALTPIKRSEFKLMLKKTRDAVKKAGIVPEDVELAIRKVRNARGS